jgi:hypothetical protein
MTQNSGLTKGKRGVLSASIMSIPVTHVVGMTRPEASDISLAND